MQIETQDSRTHYDLTNVKINDQNVIKQAEHRANAKSDKKDIHHFKETQFGYNVVKMDPTNPITAVGRGTPQPIFKAPLLKDFRYDTSADRNVPKSMNYRAEASESLDQQYAVTNSMHHIANTFEAKLNLKGEGKVDGVSVSFGLNGGFKTNYSYSKKSKTVSRFAFAKVVIADFELNTNAEFSPIFKTKVESLHNNFNNVGILPSDVKLDNPKCANYKTLIEDFGTHFCTVWRIGSTALFSEQAGSTEIKLKRELNWNIGIKAGIKKADVAEGDIDVKFSDDSKVSKFFKHKTTKTKYSVHGAKVSTLKAGDISSLPNHTILDTAIPVEMELFAIHYLLMAFNKSTYPNMDKVQQNLATVLKAYMKKAHVTLHNGEYYKSYTKDWKPIIRDKAVYNIAPKNQLDKYLGNIFLALNISIDDQNVELKLQKQDGQTPSFRFVKASYYNGGHHGEAFHIRQEELNNIIIYEAIIPGNTGDAIHQLFEIIPAFSASDLTHEGFYYIKSVLHEDKYLTNNKIARLEAKKNDSDINKQLWKFVEVPTT